jgi:hypothetical protein
MSVVRRDPQVHDRLSARFRGHGKPQERDHYVYQGFWIKRIPSHATTCLNADGGGIRLNVVFCTEIMSNVAASRVEKQVAISRLRSLVLIATIDLVVERTKVFLYACPA